ncbi:MAG: hypothetical protein EH225_02790, partial [Calditrichaeota bacterium]
MDFESGTVISHYKIIEKLGSGGMATVYKAQDLKLERFVALKFLPMQVGASDSDTQRFIQEAKTASALDHPNICTIYEINETEQGQIFIAMSFCEGETLKDKIDRGPLSTKEAIQITQQICKGLGRAHEMGIVHRDLKPANIIVTRDGVVKILDFGVAKFQHKSRFTSPGSVIGTPAYMSPEQARGKEVDQRTDIWALGVLLFQILTANLPFKGENDMALMYSIVHDPPASLSAFRSQVPEILQASLKKALAKNPEERYFSLAQFSKDLDRLHQDGNEAQETKLTAPVQGSPAESIAVLPLLDLSSEKNQEYFCDGLTEEIINALARIDGLRVASRNTSFQFKDQKLNIGQIGEKLGVRKILEGSLRKSGERIRVTIRLINVSDGFLLWSDDYERELKDIFAIQDDISRSVVENLKVKLADITGSRLIKRYTDNLEAYTAYLQGRFFWNKRTAESMERSIGQFKRAIEIDPGYALAYAGLSDVYLVLGLYGRYAPLEIMPQAISAARDALQLDEELAEAHVSLGCARSVFEWNWPDAEQEFRRGIELNPDYAVAYQWYAINLLTPLGRFSEALT